MQLPFTTEQFYAVFRDYQHRAVARAIVLLAIAVAAVVGIV